MHPFYESRLSFFSRDRQAKNRHTVHPTGFMHCETFVPPPPPPPRGPFYTLPWKVEEGGGESRGAVNRLEVRPRPRPEGGVQRILWQKSLPTFSANGCKNCPFSLGVYPDRLLEDWKGLGGGGLGQIYRGLDTERGGTIKAWPPADSLYWTIEATQEREGERDSREVTNTFSTVAPKMAKMDIM